VASLRDRYDAIPTALPGGPSSPRTSIGLRTPLRPRDGHPRGPLAAGRLIAKLLTLQTGRSFVIDNKPGAGGNIAAGHVARSAPDTGALLVVGPSHSINATLYRKLLFDPIADFTPITMLARMPNVPVARKDAPYATATELVACGRANPSCGGAA
jgi:tripartite-type tricarboxylate transporter receptor subunit TctC